MEIKPRSLPEYVQGWSERSRRETAEVFFKFSMNQQVIVTLEDGSVLITSPDKAHELQQRPHLIDLPQSFTGGNT
jgi:hypothetical protein